MATEMISRWLTLAANIGVLGGLILVALQLNQNIEIAKAQLTNDYYLADMQLELGMMGEDPIRSWIKAVYSPDEMSPEDAAVVDRYFNFGMVQLNRLRKLKDLGLADDDLLNERVGYLQWHLGNEVGRDWWSTSRQFYPADFVKAIDNVLENDDYGSNKQLLDSILPHDEPHNEQ